MSQTPSELERRTKILTLAGAVVTLAGAVAGKTRGLLYV